MSPAGLPCGLSPTVILRLLRRGRLGVIAYNLGNLPRRLVLPVAIQRWSLTSLQQRLFKTGGRLIRHARYFVLQPAESYLTRNLFRRILGRIERLAWPPT
jgi:Transposase DDE domain group 1